MKRTILAAAAFSVLPAGAVTAQASSFADYYPLEVGYSWRHVNSTNPSDFFVFDVLTVFPYGGSTISVKLGPDVNNCYIASNDGTTFKILATVESGVVTDIVPDVCIGRSFDGHRFDLEPTIFAVVRDWSDLDHSLTAAYGIDQDRTDVALWVFYDSNFGPNVQNAALESGSNGVPYNAGVTDICFYQRQLGPLAYIDVSAATGVLGPRYDVVASYDCNGNQIPDHRDIFSGNSSDNDGDGVPDECASAQATFRNGTCATNTTGYVAAAPVLGSIWTATVDNTGTPNNAAGILGYASPLDACFGLGALLVNVADPVGELIGLLPETGTGLVDFSATLPPDASLLGVDVFTQALSFSVPGGGGLMITLRNAYDLKIGY